MTIKGLVYTFMSNEKIREKVERNSKLIEKETDSKKRMKILDDEFALMEALLRKNRKNKTFTEYVRTSLLNVAIESKMREKS